MIKGKQEPWKLAMQDFTLFFLEFAKSYAWRTCVLMCFRSIACLRSIMCLRPSMFANLACLMQI